MARPRPVYRLRWWWLRFTCQHPAVADGLCFRCGATVPVRRRRCSLPAAHQGPCAPYEEENKHGD